MRIRERGRGDDISLNERISEGGFPGFVKLRGWKSREEVQVKKV